MNNNNNLDNNPNQSKQKSPLKEGGNQSSQPNQHEYYEMMIGGKYQIGQKIGAGSFGEIYHAISLQSKEDVAVKVEKKLRRKIMDSNNNNNNNNINNNGWNDPNSPIPPPPPETPMMVEPPQYQYQESKHSQLKREAKIYSMLHGEGM